METVVVAVRFEGKTDIGTDYGIVTIELFDRCMVNILLGSLWIIGEILKNCRNRSLG
jgi:hypothetical protein